MTSKVDAIHESEYGIKPQIIVSAPLRIHLMGEHSCFFGDKTLSLAVNVPVYMAVSLRNDTNLAFYYNKTNERKKLNLVTTTKFRKEDRLANLFKAVIYAYQDCGFEFSGFDVTVYSEIPPQVGFGVRNAMIVCAANAIRKLFKPHFPVSKMVSVIERACTVYLSVPFSLPDVYTALFSKKRYCILTDSSTKEYELLPFNFPGFSVLLTDCKVPNVSIWNEESFHTEKNKQALASLKKTKMGKIVYDDSIAEMNEAFEGMSEEQRRKLIFIIREFQNMNDAIDALENGALSQFVRSVNRSQDSLRELLNISCPEIDWIAKRVQEMNTNVYGECFSCARITGNGIGHSMFAILKDDDIETYMQKLVDYEKIFSFHPVTYTVGSADGALIL